MAGTIPEIKKRIVPIAKKHGLRRVWLFGSRARGEEAAKSDIDLLVDTGRAAEMSLFDLGGIFRDFEKIFGENRVDMVTVDSLEEKQDRFCAEVKKDRVLIYDGQSPET